MASAILRRLRGGLSKTRETLTGGVKRVVRLGHVDASFWEGLEETLTRCDVGVAATERILTRLRGTVLRQPEEAVPAIREEMVGILSEATNVRGAKPRIERPWVIMVVGVNGTGKTTTIAKLAKFFKDGGQSVLLAASDTYRPAAQEQLRIWAERVGTDFVGSKEGADPASVAYDALDAALSRGRDYLLIDTAGRVHTRVDLMEELRKIRRVLEKRLPGAPHEVLLVLDATTGQNALSQATLFNRALEVTGIVLCKLDGTARGGIVVAISDELKIPVRWVGVGESMDDLIEFDPHSFVEAMLG